MLHRNTMESIPLRSRNLECQWKVEPVHIFLNCSEQGPGVLPCWRTPKLHKEGENLALICANVPYFSTYEFILDPHFLKSWIRLCSGYGLFLFFGSPIPNSCVLDPIAFTSVISDSIAEELIFITARSYSDGKQQ